MSLSAPGDGGDGFLLDMATSGIDLETVRTPFVGNFVLETHVFHLNFPLPITTNNSACMMIIRCIGICLEKFKHYLFSVPTSYRSNLFI